MPAETGPWCQKVDNCAALCVHVRAAGEANRKLIAVCVQPTHSGVMAASPMAASALLIDQNLHGPCRELEILA